MVTIKRPTSTTTGPTNEAPAHELLCFGSIEWRSDIAGPMVRGDNMSGVFDVQHWRYQTFLDQQSGRWVETPSPVQINVALQPAVVEGNVVRVPFTLVLDGAAKQSVRVSMKPRIIWARPGDQQVDRVTLVPAELFFEPGAKRLPAIEVRFD